MIFFRPERKFDPALTPLDRLKFAAALQIERVLVRILAFCTAGQEVCDLCSGQGALTLK